MKRSNVFINFFFLAMLLIYTESKAQLIKGNWLVGGSGSFSSTKNTLSSGNLNFESNVLDINISPIAGYFILDKFAAGLKPSYTKRQVEVASPGGGHSNRDIFEIGPYARYYFLAKEKPFNLLTEAAYQFGFHNLNPGTGNSNTLSLMAGPAIYFTTSVGLELLVGYYKRNESIDGTSESEQKGIRMSLGLQFHLERQ